MTSDEIRNTFIDFFKKKGHSLVASSSLIPHGDPTLLLTTAGMVQMKPYFTGEQTPPNSRMVTCQKCFRTTDIEEVGDTTHATFFEMLGNFSVGDYFKKESIAWAWEFLTETVKLPPDKLWVTIYLDDDEAHDLWREIGIPAERIVRLGEEDNFWGPAGDSGPCGPCSEIYYDFGPETGCGKPDCKPGCDCARYTEFWNLVFTGLNQDREGNRTQLPKPNIDTGMGMERLTTILQGKKSVYETDLFTPLLDKVAELSGKNYGDSEENDNAMRVVSEHSRGVAFLIADGVMPSNEGRGYVLRRLLRRAALYGLRIGLDKPFLSETATVTINKMKHVYPELEQRRDFILKVIRLEEEKFSDALRTGLDLIEDIISGDVKEISGKDIFRLYDTYGFPVELTTEVAGGKGISVDLAGFETEMEKQRERAKAAHRFELAEKDELAGKLDINNTVFTGYRNLKQESTILAILAGNDSVDAVQEGQEAGIVLADTPFYGEMGGQLGDTGEIRSRTGRFSVTDTIRLQAGIIMHKGTVTEGSFMVGDEAEAELDIERRLDIARNHTATHLLQAALLKVLGDHVQQRGSLVAPDHFRFDFSHLVAMSSEEIAEVQRIVNGFIRANYPVYDQEISYPEAIAQGAIAIFDEKYGDMVRVLKIGDPPVSMELCGGTHVSMTGEIGQIIITGESSVGSGLRRIEAVTGRGAEDFSARNSMVIKQIAGLLETEPDSVIEKTKNLLEDLRGETRRANSLESELAARTAESLLDQAETVNGVTVVSAKVKSSRIEVLREMSDMLRDRLQSAIIVLGSVVQDRPIFIAAVTPDLVKRGYNAGNIVKQVAKVTGGGGGGKAELAQAGGKQKEKIDEALKLVAGIVESSGN
ncbi:MAG: alanine--tRNA ligase [Dehalococcoidales bacterium]|nr:alanine--tRNA ligase [Dehalococcoidales bacterium]